MKRKIRNEIIFICTGAIILIASLSIYIGINIFTNQAYDDLEDYEMVIESIGLDNFIDNYSHNIDLSLRVTVILEDGTVSYDSMADAMTMENHNYREEILKARADGSGYSRRTSETLDKDTYYYAALQADNSVIRVSNEYTSLAKLIRNMILIVTLLAVLIVIACIYLTNNIINKMIGPLKNMSQDIAAVDESLVYEEIRPFITTIKNQHLDIIKNSNLRKEFTDNVTHELKTPLTVISGYSELIVKGIAKPEDTKDIALKINKNAAHLRTLIDDILNISHLDDTNLEFETETVDLNEVIKKAILNVQVISLKRKIKITYQDTDIKMIANQKLMSELIENLLINSIIYNKIGGSVNIELAKKQEQIIIKISDTGIGIAKKDQKRIFERFYRVDKSRSRLNGGTGLGLAIVKHIVAYYNGSIDLVSEPNVGTQITVIF